MSYFGKVKFGKDCDYESASKVVKALHDAGLVTNQDPQQGEVYFSEGGDE